MANSAIVTSWGSNIAGREEMGLGVFMAAVQYFSERKQMGEITDLRLYVTDTGNLSQTSGHMIVEGSAEQIHALMARPEYTKIVIKAAHVVHHFNSVVAATGDEVMRRIEQLQIARKELGI